MLESGKQSRYSDCRLLMLARANVAFFDSVHDFLCSCLTQQAPPAFTLLLELCFHDLWFHSYLDQRPLVFTPSSALEKCSAVVFFFRRSSLFA